MSAQDIKKIAISWYYYLLPKWKIFFVVTILFGLLGILYAWFAKPVYTAELTFTTDNGESSGNIGAYSGIAAQFGFSMGSTSGSAFEGDNLMRLMSSQRLIQKTLLTHVSVNNQNYLLINYLAFIKDLEKEWNDTLKNQHIVFTNEDQPQNRQRDSVLKKISSGIATKLSIDKIDKRSDIIAVQFKDEDEAFAKIFVEELVKNVIQYYTDYKVKKTRQNVAILQHQTDSVRNLINGNIVAIAVANDLNVNPTREIVRTGTQRKQIDAQVNAAMYAELVKNLELSKLTLRKETPLIQIIDAPMLPLEKKKMGRLKGAVFFGFAGFMLVLIFYVFKRIFSNPGTDLTETNHIALNKS